MQITKSKLQNANFFRPESDYKFGYPNSNTQMPEAPHYAFNNCVSLNRHLSATEHMEIVNFCKDIGYFYACKVEDTVTTDHSGDQQFPEFEAHYEANVGKVHCHFLTICEEAKYSTNITDHRYGAKSKSHYRAKFIKMCPYITKALLESAAATKHGFITAQMTTDSAAVYYSKETQLRVHNLPDDLTVLRPYLSLKKKRQPNIERDTHVATYQEQGRPMPPTPQDITDYFNHRWFVANDLKCPAMPAHQENIIVAVYTAMGPQAVQVPKRLRTLSEAPLPAPKPRRYCPMCAGTRGVSCDDPEVGSNVLEPYERLCWQCKDLRSRPLNP